MIWLCVECKDFSPLQPLSWRDFIYLRECLLLSKNGDRDKLALFDDCRFYLGGITTALTGVNEWVNLPSEILRRTKFYEQRDQ
jgi:hypothetical protein